MKNDTYNIAKQKHLEINCVLSFVECSRSKKIRSVYAFLKVRADLGEIPNI